MSSAAAQLDLVIFDDGRGRFGPLDQLWPAFAVRSGALRNAARIEAVLNRRASGFFVSPDAQALTVEAYPGCFVNDASSVSAVLAVNGRWSADDDAAIDAVRGLRPGEALTTSRGELLAAHTDGPTLQTAWPNGLSAEAWDASKAQTEAKLFARPWDVLDGLEARLTRDLATMPLPVCSDLPHGVTRVGGHAIRLHARATLAPHVHLDTTLGPIALDAGAAVHPFTVLEGPCYVGPDATVAANATLRAGCAIGTGCKVGGELKASILDDFSNKAHFGYLGNALVGRWCNLGAGTTASNLKNTWGEVRVQLDADGADEATGRAFLGPVLGDFVRTAIGTTLPTGAVVGAAACLVASGFPPKHVPALTFLTDAGPEPTDLQALQRTLERMMKRRGQAPTDALMQRLEALSAARGASA
ncbi:MAG: putative sugar nucleotidyl transferase [Planctomycetota bacterium]